MRLRFILTVIFLIASPLDAQTRKNAQVGDVDIDEGSTETPYEMTQNQVIDYFTKFQSALEKPQLFTEDLNDNQLSFLNAVYLYCTVGAGACPDILDAIYEVDYLNSKATGTTTCPRMTQFWKLWLRNEMEGRQSYLVKTSNITATSEFTTKVRPKYIKCVETIAQDVRNNKGATALNAVKNTLLIMKTLKEKNINAFLATGSTPKKKDKDKDGETEK